jgi:hypothetical protein
MTSNLIRIASDTPIYRVFRLKYIGDVLQDKRLRLVPPASWEDPFESMLSYCAITYASGSPWWHECFDRILRPLFAQCWSVESESDAIWRVYSRFDKDQNSGRNKAAQEEGVRVRTTAVKLLQALWDNSPTDPTDACFLGGVRYMPEDQVKQFIADEIGKKQLQAFEGGRGHAESLLFKRVPFFHEREARLIYFENRPGSPPKEFFLPIEPNALIEEIILDPRLTADESREREETLRRMGYCGPIQKSLLYQKRLWEVIIR